MIFKDSEKLGNEIYLYRNFISYEESKKLTNVADSIPSDNWHADPLNRKRSGYTYEPLREVLNKIQSIVPEGLSVAGSLTFIKMEIGADLDVHSDECPHCLKKDKNESNKYYECTKYGMVIYFSEFEGGEIYYPEQDIIVSPKPGDLVIHGSAKICAHGVKPVTKGIRYSMAPYIVYKNYGI